MDRNETLDRLERALIAGLINRRTFIVGALATGLLLSSTVSARADELDAMREAQARNRRSLKRSYDYIVVGAGSAGCALVGTLAKREPSAQILLIEAGDWDTAPSIEDPRLWFTNLGTVRDWNDVSIPTASTNNHPVPEHTGRVIGGGSSINATIWARPFKADLDHWAAETGDDRWGYEHGLRFSKASRTGAASPDPAFRGEGGPVWVQPAADPLPMATACLEAFRELGLPVLDDLNGEREITGNGFAYMNQIIEHGRRHSMARAFLYPVLARKNVTVLVNTQVNRVILERAGPWAWSARERQDPDLPGAPRDHPVHGRVQHAQAAYAQRHRRRGAAARVRHPRTGALTQRGPERDGPRPSRGVPLRGSRAVHVHQQRKQRVGLLQDRPQLRAARRQHRGDRAALRERHHRRGVPRTAQHVGAVRWPGHAGKPRHGDGSGPATRPTSRSWICAS